MDHNHLETIHSRVFCVVMFVQLSPPPGNALGCKARGSSRKKTHPAGKRYGSIKFRRYRSGTLSVHCFEYSIVMIVEILYDKTQSQGENRFPKLPASGLSAGSRCGLHGWHHLGLARIDDFFRFSWWNASWVAISNQERRCHQQPRTTASIINIKSHQISIFLTKETVLSTLLHVSQ